VRRLIWAALLGAVWPILGARAQVPDAAPPNVSAAVAPQKLPILPIPDIGTDPNSGTTVGLLPVWLSTNDQGQITRIFAPDVLHNPYFGYGGDARILAYPSADTQWSITGGAKERIERGFDAEYETGRLRDSLWSLAVGLQYSRIGTPRFYGIGNETPASAESVYTEEQGRAEMRLGLNITPALQLRETIRYQVVDVLPGQLTEVPSLQTLFGNILGVGTSEQLLERISISYDTRNDLTVPTRGMQVVAYGGIAGRAGILNDNSFSETGVDGRVFVPVGVKTILAVHAALRYLPSAQHVPFWALSTLGGDRSEIGGVEPLRGYGAGRYYDRDSFSATVELRRNVFSFNALSTHVDLEASPFIDSGRVFASGGTFPLSQLHTIGGVGIRGIAPPFVVGYVDIGYGDQGVAVFSGINYPF
jgi:outer membrane protein assembly factor BamA